MKLHALVTQYVTYRKSLGAKFRRNEYSLKAFVRAVGQNKNISDVQPKQVNTYLAGNGPITTNWHEKHQALNGFYRYVLSRGYCKESPLPTIIPKRPRPLVPYIYSVKELHALLGASLTFQKKINRVEPYTVRMILLLLYGTGLRISEAIKLTMADVNLPQALLIIRETKFYKSRLVPIGTEMTQALSQYAVQRKQKGYSMNSEEPFFIGRDGKAVYYFNIETAFKRIRKKAGVRRTDGGRFQPRLHDLRHTFAVHRLTAWYKDGADVQRLLPMLSVYLGHTQLAETSTYLTMTPAILEEAGRRFQQYVFKEESHD